MFVVFLFVHSWEQRKLGEVAFYRRGSFPQPYGKKEWYDGNGAMSFVQVADVTDEMNLVENTKQKISTLAQPMSVYADKNSVLVTLQGSIGRVAITQYGAFIDRTVLIFEKYKEPINILFWAYIIKQKFIEEAHKAPGGTIKTITKEALSDFDLLLPKYDEQSRVGTFFKQLDNLITLHQREVFSKNIIFKNIKFGGLGTENNTWEQRKLSDMCSIITKQTGFDYSETIKPSLITEPREDTYSFIQNKDFDGENINFDTDFYIPISIANKYPRITLDCPSLLISISGKIGNVGYYNYLKKSFIGGAVGICKLLRANGSIIVYALQSNAGQRYFHSLIKASSHANITVQDIRNINVMLPRNEAEEIKVSQLLRSIDNLITLHQRIKIFITGDYHDKKNK